MKISIIESGMFKLDGGAMFGVVPKSMWSKLNPPDERNLCPWAMRLLLIEQGDQKILIDTGIGTKQDERFMSHFEPHGDDSITTSLSAHGVSHEDITDVILTHMHFDHVGGALVREGSHIVPSFPNATYWSCKEHFDWAMNPNEREKASFLKENIEPLMEHGVLNFIPKKEGHQIFDNIKMHFSYGHTEAMMIPHITMPNGNKLIYCADLMPSSFHIRKPYVMAYDIRPLETLKEREELYKVAIQDDYYLFFEHDPVNPYGKLKQNEKGRYYVDTEVNIDHIVS
ncbi:MBL fold metallo-hydrolase [Saprospiraceae bacterium]|nr:MBL fold metallo-hydrolase [Saprospiraceae bacterium]